MFGKVLDWLAVRLAPRVGEELAPAVVAALDRHVNDTLLPEVQKRAEMAGRDLLGPGFLQKALIGSELFLPGPVVAGIETEDYMATSTPVARDFLHPKFAEFARLYGLPFALHRKYWEWAFIYEQLRRHDMLAPGKRGLGFGVGREMLPAMFARLGAAITATDSPSDAANWRDTGQYAGNKDGLFGPHILSREEFDARVDFEPCDMTQIPPHLNGFDFCWSSCCFEHLGTLERGLEFVVNSVERTLAVGGVACHTTEFNLSSDEQTIVAGQDVIYRHRDLLQLCRTLEERGHQVEPLRIDPGNLVPDYLVDVPPYRGNPHLKLYIGPYVSTSIGLVMRRGR